MRPAALRRAAAVGIGALAIAAALAPSACGGGEVDGAATTTTVSPLLGPDLLEHPDAARDLIRSRFGESPSLRRLTISADSLWLELRDPAKPDNIDHYRYDPATGEWPSDPVRMSLSDIAELDEVTFLPGAIAWDRIPDLIQQAYDGLDLEGEEITSVSVDRIAGDPPRIYIGVNGLRGDGRLLANADGTDVDISRN